MMSNAASYDKSFLHELYRQNALYDIMYIQE